MQHGHLRRLTLPPPPAAIPAACRQLYVAVGKLLGIEEDGPSAAAAAGDAAAAGPSSSKESAAERVLLMAQVAQSSLSYSAPKTQFFTDLEVGRLAGESQDPMHL